MGMWGAHLEAIILSLVLGGEKTGELTSNTNHQKTLTFPCLVVRTSTYNNLVEISVSYVA